MKNYLVKNGEAELHLIIERESDRLHADEFLNIDAILESVLNKILLGNWPKFFDTCPVKARKIFFGGGGNNEEGVVDEQKKVRGQN